MGEIIISMCKVGMFLGEPRGISSSPKSNPPDPVARPTQPRRSQRQRGDLVAASPSWVMKGLVLVDDGDGARILKISEKIWRVDVCIYIHMHIYIYICKICICIYIYICMYCFDMYNINFHGYVVHIYNIYIYIILSFKVTISENHVY